MIFDGHVQRHWEPKCCGQRMKYQRTAETREPFISVRYSFFFFLIITIFYFIFIFFWISSIFCVYNSFPILFIQYVATWIPISHLIPRYSPRPIDIDLWRIISVGALKPVKAGNVMLIRRETEPKTHYKTPKFLGNPHKKKTLN